MIAEPNYHLTDASGDLIGTIGVDSSGAVVIDHAASGELVTIDADGIHGDALTISDATITTELTDPAGVTHTSELAELSDIPDSLSDPGNVLGGSTGESTDTAVHPDASAAGGASVAISNATAGGFEASAIGNQTEATASGSTAVGSRASATGTDSTAIGVNAVAPNDEEGVLGEEPGSFASPSWVVPGDFTVQGSKNFEIDHPLRPDTHRLRHGNYEGDVSGGLIYRREVSITLSDGASEGTATLQMPEWFGPLATNVDVVVQAQGHFGDAYAEREEPTGTDITVTANESGDYTVVIYATRDDENVPNPSEHTVTRPKGAGWDGEPRAYYRNARGVDTSQYEGVKRVEQFFDHTAECDPTPCETAFEEWCVTLADGERVDVDEPMDAAPSVVIAAALETHR